MQAREKLTHRVEPHTTFEPEGIQRGDYETRQPVPALFRFPQPRLWMAVATRHCVLETMDTALRQSGLLGNAAHTLPAVVTQTLENP